MYINRSFTNLTFGKHCFYFFAIIAIDDIMLFPINKAQSASFYNLIDQLYELASKIIITTNPPKQRAETLKDDLLATALFDRLLYWVGVLKLTGTSYRMEDRRNIFPDKSIK